MSSCANSAENAGSEDLEGKSASVADLAKLDLSNPSGRAEYRAACIKLFAAGQLDARELDTLLGVADSARRDPQQTKKKRGRGVRLVSVRSRAEAEAATTAREICETAQ